MSVSFGETLIMIILISQGIAANMLWRKVCNVEDIVKKGG